MDCAESFILDKPGQLDACGPLYKAGSEEFMSCPRYPSSAKIDKDAAKALQEANNHGRKHADHAKHKGADGGHDQYVSWNALRQPGDSPSAF